MAKTMINLSNRIPVLVGFVPTTSRPESQSNDRCLDQVIVSNPIEIFKCHFEKPRVSINGANWPRFQFIV